MDAQSPPDGSGAYVGIALADLGAQVEVMRAHGATDEPRDYVTARFDAPPAPDELIERIGAVVARMGAPSVAAVGVAVWDQVNPAGGELRDARYGGAWAGFPFANRLAERLSASVRLDSGVNAAALAEAARIRRSPLLYVHVGRSLASALVVDGAPLAGARGDAGRLHHWQTGRESPRCVCGAQGHLGALISAQSLVRLAIGVAAQDDTALEAVQRVTHGRAEALTAAQLITLASQEVRPLRELVDYAVDALADALANLSTTLDPAVILIGGAVALADEVFFVRLRERVAERLVGVGAGPDIASASLGARGAAIGATLLARG